jgi:diacylglycerol kinase
MKFLTLCVRKFTYALRGLTYTARRELSFRLELVAAVLALGVAWWLGFSTLAWALLLLTMGVVLAVEVVNTVLERLLDLIEPRLSLHVALLKDMLAGALLVLVVVASLIGWLLVRATTGT